METTRKRRFSVALSPIPAKSANRKIAKFQNQSKFEMSTTVATNQSQQIPPSTSAGADDQTNLDIYHRNRRHTTAAESRRFRCEIIAENQDATAHYQAENPDFKAANPPSSLNSKTTMSEPEKSGNRQQAAAKPANKQQKTDSIDGTNQNTDSHQIRSRSSDENTENPDQGGEIDGISQRNSHTTDRPRNQQQAEVDFNGRYHNKISITRNRLPACQNNNIASRRRTAERLSSDGDRQRKKDTSYQQPCEFHGFPKIGTHYALLHPIMNESDGGNDTNNNNNNNIDSHLAVHIQTKELKICQWVSPDQYAHFIQVRDRLHRPFSSIQQSGSLSHQEMIEPFEASRARSIINNIIPNDTEVVRHEGHFFLFTPQHFGSLHSYVQGRGRLSEEESRLLYHQIVQIVAYCHSVGVVVRDLKLRKFVFVDEARTMLRMSSVSDLVVCQRDNDDALEDRHGCPAYVSPEILDLTQRTYSGKAADIWSLGVLLFAMLMGRYPFYDPTPAGLFAKIRAGAYWIPPPPPSTEDEFSSGVEGSEGCWTIGLEVRLLLRSLLRRCPRERPTAEQLSDAGWLRRGGIDGCGEDEIVSTGEAAASLTGLERRKRQLIALKRRWRYQRRIRRNRMTADTANNSGSRRRSEMLSIDEGDSLEDDQTVPTGLAPSIFSLNGVDHSS